ncbi:hypothetical protein F5B20DRAFT_534460 [Whalleya microplaca]|nr:hypothetical protein F5B20DRAFT_534460 [Whalleya microplaca]
MATRTDSLPEKSREEHQNARLHREHWMALAIFCGTGPFAVYTGFQAYQKFDGWENSTTLEKVNLVRGLIATILTVLVAMCYGPLLFRWMRNWR